MEIEFHNRKEEIEEIMEVLSHRPDSIYFVYGPINSGKTELFQYLINQLPKEYVVFYINLRERMTRDYKDFIETLFEVREDKRRFILKRSSDTTKFVGFPISKALFNTMFREDKSKNAFRYIVSITEELKEKGKKPILILDEVQKIGDVKLDNYLIYELFNLLIRLTKEKHSCHVFAVTSNSLFLEKVYNEAMLQGRCDYLLVDDFDYNTTVNFLEKYNFNKEEIQMVWEYLGGKPVYLVKAIKNKHRLKEFCRETLEDRVSSILYEIKNLKRENEQLFQKVVNLFEQFKESETTECYEINEEVIWVVKNNILFLDPRKRLLKPQSKVDLLAIRRILKEFI